MKSKLTLGARVVLGLIFFVFGLNGFFMFMPMPEIPEQAGAFLGGLAGSGYFFPVLKATETLCGLALLTGFFVPLVLIVLAPITLQIFLFHLMLAPSGLPMAIVMVALHVYLGVSHLDRYRSLLRSK